MHQSIVLGVILSLCQSLLPGSALAEAVFLQSYRLTLNEAEFGGFSAISLSQGGRGLTLLSDRGEVYEGEISRDPAGRIAGVALSRAGRLRGQRDPYVSFFRGDAEGIAAAPDGGFYVSFEHWHSVWYYPGWDAKPRALPRHPDFGSMQRNSSLEALATDADGRIYTIPERSGQLDRPFPVYRFQKGNWDVPFSIPRRGEFLVVGADIGPDGRFYVLERSYRRFLGFESRLRRFDMTGGGLTNEVTLLRTARGRHDNLEGLHIWQAPDGLRATMVSDDNFNWFQLTELVEYRLDDP